jgi:hypothetical protein
MVVFKIFEGPVPLGPHSGFATDVSLCKCFVEVLYPLNYEIICEKNHQKLSEKSAQKHFK